MARANELDFLFYLILIIFSVNSNNYLCWLLLLMLWTLLFSSMALTIFLLKFCVAPLYRKWITKISYAAIQEIPWTILKFFKCNQYFIQSEMFAILNPVSGFPATKFSSWFLKIRMTFCSFIQLYLILKECNSIFPPLEGLISFISINISHAHKVS